MTQLIDIAEIARRTGLSARALRFYEARGLVKPLRTYSGRRCYGAGELERLDQLIALKRAGLSLQQIKALFDKRPIDLHELLTLRLADVEAQARTLSDIREVLTTTLSRIDRGEPIDAATFCSLIRFGDTMMSDEAQQWQAVTERYMSAEAKADFARTMPQMGDTADSRAIGEAWKDLGSRIKAAMPMDPTSEQAADFVREWCKLLEPFAQVATPAMWQGSQNMYSHMSEWEGQADPGFDASVVAFIQQAMTALKAKGENPLPVPMGKGA